MNRADRAAVWGLLLGLVLAVLWLAPARWVAAGLAQASAGRVLLVQPQGTWWQGQAGLELSGGTGAQDRTALPGGVAWRLTPVWGEGWGLQLQVQAACCTTTPVLLHLRPRWLGTSLALDVALPAHQSQWPAALLMGLGTPWNTLQLQAGVHVHTPGLTLRLHAGRVFTEGQLVVELRDASSRLSTVQPMGSYRLAWQGAGLTRVGSDALSDTLTLSTLQGALLLQGQGQWLSGRLRFSGEAQAAPGREDALSNLMNILGRRQGGRTLIQMG